MKIEIKCKFCSMLLPAQIEQDIKNKRLHYLIIEHICPKLQGLYYVDELNKCPAQKPTP